MLKNIGWNFGAYLKLRWILFMNQLGWNRGVIFRPWVGIVDDSFLFLSNNFHHFAVLHFIFNSCDVPMYASEYKNSCALQNNKTYLKANNNFHHFAMYISFLISATYQCTPRNIKIHVPCKIIKLIWKRIIFIILLCIFYFWKFVLIKQRELLIDPNKKKEELIW